MEVPRVQDEGGYDAWIPRRWREAARSRKRVARQHSRCSHGATRRRHCGLAAINTQHSTIDLAQLTWSPKKT
jgi:hypothetical protein